MGEKEGMSEGIKKGEKRSPIGDLSNWKHSQVSKPEDVDGLTTILSMEIDHDLTLLEKRLDSYWKKKRSYR